MNTEGVGSTNSSAPSMHYPTQADIQRSYTDINILYDDRKNFILEEIKKGLGLNNDQVNRFVQWDAQNLCFKYSVSDISKATGKTSEQVNTVISMMPGLCESHLNNPIKELEIRLNSSFAADQANRDFFLGKLNEFKNQSIKFEEIVKPNIKETTQDVILTLGLLMMQTYDEKMNGYLNDMKSRNYQMQNVNKALIALRNGGNANTEFDFAKTDGTIIKKKLSEFMTENNIAYNADKTTNIDNMKTLSDTLGSTSQIEQQKMQSVLNKYNEVTQMVSNIMSKFSQMAMAIIGNMR